MKCWNCGSSYEPPSWGKMPFRAYCEKCQAALHCCRNCVYFKPGLPNDCAIPGTDFIADRAAANLCEEFKAHGQGPTKCGDPSEASKRLFGQEEEELRKEDPKKGFNSLFKEENPS
jgi:hypothetical protein